MKSELYRVDVCFVVDTTGSMGPFIDEAKKKLREALQTLSSETGVDLNVGLVEYRDHPPMDPSFVTRINDLTGDLDKIQKVIRKLKPDGGGDEAEAVYSGIDDACSSLAWRKHSLRFIVLVGDAPPHGFSRWHQQFGPAPDGSRPRRNRLRSYDHWRDGCPSGLDVQRVSAHAEREGITIHAIVLGASAATQESFSAISMATGGSTVNSADSGDVIGKIIEVLSNEFSYVEFDKNVLDTVGGGARVDTAQLAEQLDCPRLKVAASIARLGKRGLL